MQTLRHDCTTAPTRSISGRPWAATPMDRSAFQFAICRVFVGIQIQSRIASQNGKNSRFRFGVNSDSDIIRICVGLQSVDGKVLPVESRGERSEYLRLKKLGVAWHTQFLQDQLHRQLKTHHAVCNMNETPWITSIQHPGETSSWNRRQSGRQGGLVTSVSRSSTIRSTCRFQH